MNLDLSKVTKVRMVIFQPRLQSEPDCPEWSCDLKTLYAFGDKAKAAVQRCEDALQASGDLDDKYSAHAWTEKYLKPSEKGCTWCKAKATCPALAKECLQGVLAPATTDGLFDLDDLTHANEVGTTAPGLDLTDDIKYAVANVPNLDFDTLARLYAAKGLFSNWLEAVENRMLTELLNGESHADWKLVQGRAGHRKWRDKADAEATMRVMRLKMDEMYDKEIISPTDAEKLLKKQRPKLWTRLQPLIDRSEGKPNVAKMTDKRPGINPQAEALLGLPDYTQMDFEDLV